MIDQLFESKDFYGFINKDVEVFIIYKSPHYKEGIRIIIKEKNKLQQLIEYKTNEIFKNLEKGIILDILPEFKIYARKKKIENL